MDISPLCSTWCLAGLELLEQHCTLGSPRLTRATPQPSPGESMLQLFVHSTLAEKSSFSSPFPKLAGVLLLGFFSFIRQFPAIVTTGTSSKQSLNQHLLICNIYTYNIYI